MFPLLCGFEGLLAGDVWGEVMGDVGAQAVARRMEALAVVA